MGHFHLAQSESKAICSAVIIIIKLRETPIALFISLWRRAPVGGGGVGEATSSNGGGGCILLAACRRVERRKRFLASHSRNL
jgi:hypothetical protein